MKKVPSNRRGLLVFNLLHGVEQCQHVPGGVLHIAGGGDGHGILAQPEVKDLQEVAGNALHLTGGAQSVVLLAQEGDSDDFHGIHGDAAVESIITVVMPLSNSTNADIISGDSILCNLFAAVAVTLTGFPSKPTIISI